MKEYQKKIVFLKDTGSHPFDEVLFIINRRCEKTRIDQSDTVYETNLSGKKTMIRGKGKGANDGFFIPFFLGALNTF